MKIYAEELAEVRAEAREEGFTEDTINGWEDAARATVRRLGFEDAHHVRRAADKFGTRIFH